MVPSITHIESYRLYLTETFKIYFDADNLSEFVDIYIYIYIYIYVCVCVCVYTHKHSIFFQTPSHTRKETYPALRRPVI
jgi:hypothetical protein